MRLSVGDARLKGRKEGPKARGKGGGIHVPVLFEARRRTIGCGCVSWRALGIARVRVRRVLMACVRFGAASSSRTTFWTGPSPKTHDAWRR